MSESDKVDECFAIIVTAIRERRVLSLKCDGLARVVEPYLIYESQSGALLLHGWQTSGQFRSSPPPDWCNLKLEQISQVTGLDKRYDRPHTGYNPTSSQFHRVLVSAPPTLMARRAGKS